MAFFLSCLALSCRLQQGTDGAHGPDEAVGAVGATFHVGTWEHWNGMGARATWATWATWTSQPGQTSALHHMAPGHHTRRSGHEVVASTFPLGVSLPYLPLLPLLTCSVQPPASPPAWAAARATKPVVFPELCPCLCLCGPCASPACSPCLALLVLGCQELFFALPCLLMLGLPCILPLPCSPAHCVSGSRDTSPIFRNKFSFCPTFLW